MPMQCERHDDLNRELPRLWDSAMYCVRRPQANKIAVGIQKLHGRVDKRTLPPEIEQRLQYSIIFSRPLSTISSDRVANLLLDFSSGCDNMKMSAGGSGISNTSHHTLGQFVQTSLIRLAGFTY